MALWSQLRSPRLALLLGTLALCLVRARDQPGLDVGLGGDDCDDRARRSRARRARGRCRRRARAARVPRSAWAALVCGHRLLRSRARDRRRQRRLGVRLRREARRARGARARDARARLHEAAARGDRRRAAPVHDRRRRRRARATSRPAAEGVKRRSSASTTSPPSRRCRCSTGSPLRPGPSNAGRRAALAIVAGGIGCILGAALASLLGLYLGAAALLAIAALRRRLAPARARSSTARRRRAVTAGTLTLRSGDLGFLQSWFGKPASTPGPVRGELEPAADLRVHRRPGLPRPPAARHRLVRRAAAARVRALPPGCTTALPRPARPLLPARRRHFIPQQTYDQVLYELGLVGGARRSLGLLVALGRRLRAAPRGAPRGVARARCRAAWLAGVARRAGRRGLFGGTPLAADASGCVAGVALAVIVRERCSAE